MANQYYDFPYLYIENFFTAGQCRDIVENTEQDCNALNAEIKTTILDSIVVPAIDDSIRKTVSCVLSEYSEDAYNKTFLSHQSIIESFFKIALITTSKVQTLKYTEGSFYVKHADDSNEVVNNDKETIGFLKVAPHRKLTSVLFITTNGEKNDFEGGELVFNYLYDSFGNNIVIRPKAGDMIIFPSNPIFSHEVKLVRSGTRITLVRWYNTI